VALHTKFNLLNLNKTKDC